MRLHLWKRSGRTVGRACGLLLAGAFYLLALGGSSLAAQEARPKAGEAADSVRLAEMERRLDALTRELERMRLGSEILETEAPKVGLGPAASRVYRVKEGASLAGYGEVLYENFSATKESGTPSGAVDRFDALRAILYVGYKFNDRILFNSEIEIEHADEIGLEFAYVDYKLTENVGARGGILLIPMGLINELHEPLLFLGTERPVTETRILPTTWRENGVGLFGNGERFAWRAYVVNSFDAAGFSGASLRGGRQKGSKARADDLALTGRFDWVGTPGLTLGASAFWGRTGQGRTLAGETVAGEVLVWDAHLDYKRDGIELRGLVAGARLSDPTAVNDLNGLSGADGVGKDMLGWYIQAGYDVLRRTQREDQLLPYVRYEEVNTQRSVAPGFAADPANDLSVLSLGLAWKPVSEIVVKAGYQIHGNGANTGVNQWNVQLGWLF
ncbi:MAG: porin [Gemmatimonadota bacterium]